MAGVSKNCLSAAQQGPPSGHPGSTPTAVAWTPGRVAASATPTTRKGAARQAAYRLTRSGGRSCRVRLMSVCAFKRCHGHVWAVNAKFRLPLQF